MAELKKKKIIKNSDIIIKFDNCGFFFGIIILITTFCLFIINDTYFNEWFVDDAKICFFKYHYSNECRFVDYYYYYYYCHYYYLIIIIFISEPMGKLAFRTLGNVVNDYMVIVFSRKLWFVVDD